MFCSKCGAILDADSPFCDICGELILDNTQPVEKKNRTPLKILFFSTISILLCASILLLSFSFFPKRVDFDFPFNDKGVEKFMKAVCSNVDAELIEIDDIDSDVDRFDDLNYEVSLRIKLKGYTEETIYISLDNKNERDTINSLTISFYDSNSENYINCVAKIAEAIELTISGRTNIRQYFDKFQFSRQDNTFADYQLTDDVHCSLTCSLNSGTFTIYRETL